MAARAHDSESFRMFMQSSNLYMIPYNSTHHVHTTDTFIDHCIMNDQEKVVDFGKRKVTFLSAHDLIYVIYDLKIVRREGRSMVCRDRRGMDAGNLVQRMRDLDWRRVMETEDVNEKVRIFTSMLVQYFNSVAPKRKVYFKNLPAPWLTSNIKNAMRKR